MTQVLHHSGRSASRPAQSHPCTFCEAPLEHTVVDLGMSPPCESFLSADQLILPWNLRDEIIQQLDDVRAWGTRFVVPIPEVQVL